MDATMTCISNPSEKLSSSVWKTNGVLLLVLLILATAIRVWLLCHTEVTSRDSIGFERYAWELEHKKWKQVLRSNLHHPLYPLTVLAVSVPVRQIVGGSDLVVMQASAQLASGLGGILLVIPMFFLGKELFDRRVGFWAAAIFQCLPVGARVMSDALSESVFLLISTIALLLALRAFRTGSMTGFVGCGCCAGLAYLTRPEGILIAVAVAVALVGRRLFVQRQKVWTEIASQLAGLIAATALVAGPYIAIIQGFSNKTTTRDLLKSEIRQSRSELTATDETRNKHGSLSVFVPCFIRGPMLSAFGFRLSDFGIGFSNFAIWWPDGKVSDLPGHLWWSLYALASELSKGFFYVAWIPALIGLFTYRARLRFWSGEMVLLVLCLLQCLALLRVAMVAGYVADRHVLIIVLGGLYWAVAALFFLVERIRKGASWFRTLCPRAALLFLALVLVALPKTLEPLHANRAGHHAVGLWLAEHITPADEIDDPFCWAAHYAGRTFLRETPEASLSCTPCFRYVVHDCRPDHRDRFRKPSAPIGNLVAAGGQVVYHWPEEVHVEEANILLFAVPLTGNK